jgi:ferredoxin
METTIYYYSATGNSLAYARAIAREIGGARVEPLAQYRNTPARPGTPRVGIIFPIIAWGPPPTVEEFLSVIDLEGIRYFFAVTTCGGVPAGTLPRLGKSLRQRGGELHAGFVVRAPGYLKSQGRQAAAIAQVQRLSGRPFGSAEERLPEIVRAVREERRVRPERSAILGSLLGNFYHDRAAPLFRSLDASYKIAPSCTGCRTCVRVCPRGNISRDNGTSVWHHDCEFCGACSTWCPQHAIGFDGNVAPTKDHNGLVSVQDFYLR